MTQTTLPSLSRPPRIGTAWAEFDNAIYAGIVRGFAGEPDYHLLVHPEHRDATNWDDAMQWAERLGPGYFLPLRKEQAVLFGNVPELFARRWYWSGDQGMNNEACAWVQDFGLGYQNNFHMGNVHRARAVRRLSIIQ